MAEAIVYDHSEEIIDVVDDHDIVLFQTAKQDAYDRNLRKRIAHVLVIDPATGNIGIQNRGLHISWQPGFYCSTACGHAAAGETWEQGAGRELQEEMGVSGDLHFIGKFPYDCEHGKRHYLGIYTIALPPETLRPDAREVSALHFYTPDDIRGLIARGEKLQNHFKAVLGYYLDALPAATA